MKRMVGEMEESTISIRCLDLTQPIGSFYIGIMSYRDLLRISYADVRRIADPELETYLGIQRELSPRRVKELQRYVCSLDATFPTSVILAVSSDDVDYDPQTQTMVIRDDEGVAKVIDGQHRIKGLEAFSGQTFDLNVTIFVDMDIEDQAMVFATINIAQTKVSKSLVYDLYEFTKRPSPQKTSHNVAKLLNARPGSPFEARIKILGRATRRYQTLTQAAFVEALIRLISGSVVRAEDDRELIKRGKKPPRATQAERQTLVFRDMFIDGKDAEIARVVWNYFAAVRDRWPEAWNGVDIRGNMLPRTNGFRALMRFLPYVYWTLGGPPSIAHSSRFLKVFQAIELNDGEFTTTRYEPGSSGESGLLRDFLELSGLG